MSAPHIDPVNVRKRLVGAIALPLILMGLLAGVLFWQIRHLITLEGWVEHTDRAIINAQQTQKLFLDMQLGWRGYFITGRAEYLAPYQDAADKIDRSLAELAGVVTDNPEQVTRVNELRAVQAEWAAFGREVIDLKQSGADAQAIIEQGRGEILREKLNELFAGFIQNETRLRDERTLAARAATRAVLWTALGLIILIGCIIAFFSRRQLLDVSENYRRSLTNEQEQARAVQASQDRYQAFLRNSTEAIWRFELTAPVSLDSTLR